MRRSQQIQTAPVQARQHSRMQRATGLTLRELGSVVVKLKMFILIGLFAIVALQGSIPLPHALVGDRVEALVEERWPGVDLRIGHAALDLGRGTSASRLVLSDIEILDEAGQTVATSPEVSGGFSVMNALRGKWTPNTVDLKGATARILRTEDGTLALDINRGNGGGQGISLARLRALPVIDGLETVRLSGINLTYEDRQSGRLWESNDADLSLNRAEAATVISLRGAFSHNAGQPARITGRLSIPDDPGEPLRLIADFTKASPRQIAGLAPPLSWMKWIEAPVGGNLSLALDDASQVTEFAGVLDVGSGQILRQSAPSVPFDQAKAYFNWDAARDRLALDRLSLTSPQLTIAADGAFLLKRDAQGVPDTVLADLSINALNYTDPATFAAPLDFDSGHLGARLHLDSQRIDIGQLDLRRGDARISTTGRIAPGAARWTTDLTLALSDIDRDMAVNFWPVPYKPNTRKWIDGHILAGQFDAAQVRFQRDDTSTEFAVNFRFHDAHANILRTMPDVTQAVGHGEIANKALRINLTSGFGTEASGNPIDLAGSTFEIADITLKPATAVARITGQGQIPDLLALVDRKPLEFMQKIKRSPDIADGQADVDVTLRFPMIKELRPKLVQADVTATLRNVTSSTLVPNRPVRAERLALSASNTSLEIAGPAQLSGVPLTFTWTRELGPGSAPGSNLTARLQADDAALRAFGITLPRGSLTGAAKARLDLAIRPEQRPKFDLTADLTPATVSIPALGWSKPAGTEGQLTLSGAFGAPVTIDRLAMTAPGLRADGTLILDNGGLKEARFDRLTTGGWLDGPVRFRPARSGAPAIMRLEGGTLALSRRPKSGGGGDMRIGLDQVALEITDSIRLTGATAELSTGDGLQGRMSARVNSGAEINAILQKDGRIYLQSDAGGEALADAGVFRQAAGGELTAVLQPQGRAGQYRGALRLTGARVGNAPALAELMSAASIVGIADLLSGPGVGFDEVDLEFELTPERIDIWNGRAVSPSMGITLNGTYATASRQLDMEGVFSPVYFVNGFFSQIPGLGRLLGGRSGEGLVGMTYAMQGPAKSPRVTVNPLSVFTPGAFRQIFQRDPGYAGDASRAN